MPESTYTIDPEADGLGGALSLEITSVPDHAAASRKVCV